MIVSFIFHTAVHVASPVVSLTCTFGTMSVIQEYEKEITATGSGATVLKKNLHTLFTGNLCQFLIVHRYWECSYQKEQQRERILKD